MTDIAEAKAASRRKAAGLNSFLKDNSKTNAAVEKIATESQSHLRTEKKRIIVSPSLCR
jgi:hypothetical protein